MGNLIIQVVAGSGSVSITGDGIEITVESQVPAEGAPTVGTDITGRRVYIVDPGSGVTITERTPAQAGSAANTINGAMKNLTMNVVGETGHGFDYRAAGFNSNVTTPFPMDMVTGDIAVAVKSLDVITNRRGHFEKVMEIHCVASQPPASAILRSPVTWTGDVSPAWYTFDVNTWFSNRPVMSGAGVTWEPWANIEPCLKSWGMYPAFQGASVSEEVSPQLWGEYGDYSAARIGLAMLALSAPVSPDSPYTEAQIKELACAIVAHGLSWYDPMNGASSRYPTNGGYWQMHIGPVAFALANTGRSAELANVNDLGGAAYRSFKVENLAFFEAHNEQYYAGWARLRTLGPQPGGTTLRIPWVPTNTGSLGGWDVEGSKLFSGARVVNQAGTVEATTAEELNFGGVPGTPGPYTKDIELTGTSPFSEGDIVYFMPDVGTPVQLGMVSFEHTGFLLPDDRAVAAVCFNRFAAYHANQSWGPQYAALKALGIWHSSLDVALAVTEALQRTNYPSSINNWAAHIPADWYAENWNPAWSAIAAPAAFVVGNWTLNAGGDVSITALPDCGGLIINEIEYRLGGGAWVSADSQIADYTVLNSRTIAFTIPSYAGENVEIRALNFDGTAGAASDIKAA